MREIIDARKKSRWDAGTLHFFNDLFVLDPPRLCSIRAVLAEVYLIHSLYGHHLKKAFTF